jgi:hypothetical protein
MLVKVEQKHIDNGARRSCRRCPIALALREQTGTLWVVGSAFASEGEVKPAWKGVSKRIKTLPDAVIRFFYEFDRNRPVKPLEFEL